MAVAKGDLHTLISKFISSVKSDLDSPVTSNFGNRIPEYKAEAQRISVEIDGDGEDFERLRRLSKEVEEAMTVLAKNLRNFGQAAKDLAVKWTARSETQSDTDAAVALLKMELFMKNEEELTSSLAKNWHNNIVYPMELLVEAPSETRNRGVDRACREYEHKFIKVETEAKKHAKHMGYQRSQLSHGELSEQLTRERLMAEYELCKFLLGVDMVEDRRGPQLLRQFMDLFRNQAALYNDHLRINEHFRRDLELLEERMMLRNSNRCQQRNALHDLKGQLESSNDFSRSSSGSRRTNRDSAVRSSRASSIGIGGRLSPSSFALGSDPLVDLANSTAFHPDVDLIQSGHLYKRSNKKLHKQWQKRRCRIEDGHFYLSHSDESLPPTKLSLLISDCKPSVDDPKSFDLYCRDRTYHLQADSETDSKRWMLALKREIARVKTKMLTAETPRTYDRIAGATRSELFENKHCVSRIRQLSGNSLCADCSSTNDVQWLSNSGALVCIACSGVHRELGVHVSRIQSLNLDFIPPFELLIPLSTGNAMINRLYEFDTTKSSRWKPTSGCNRYDRQRFIQMKYRDRAFVQKLDWADTLFADALNDDNFENAYRALLSSSVTKKLFELNGAFHKMIMRDSPITLPVIALIVQLRVEIPQLEPLIMECIQHGSCDVVSVLLHHHSLNTPGLQYHLYVECAENAKQTKIADMLRAMQSSDGGQSHYFTLPSALLIGTPDSASLSRSSSSVSPLARHSTETSSHPVTPLPVNVLMRNGTTLAVTTGLERTFDGSLDTSSVRRILEENEPDQISQCSDVIQPATTANSSPFSDSFMSSRVFEHSDGLPSTSREPVNSLTTVEVPLQSSPSLPFSNIERRTAVEPNKYEKAPLIEFGSRDGPHSEALKSLSIFSTHPAPAVQTMTRTGQYSRSASEFSPAKYLPQDTGGTIRSLPGSSSVSSSLAKESNGAASAFSIARASFMTSEERSRLLASNLMHEKEAFSRRGVNNMQTSYGQWQSLRRVNRPPPPPPAPLKVKLKPPIPVPRQLPNTDEEKTRKPHVRRCRALYDCTADHPDELSFKQGDIIVVSKEHIAGEIDTWMEGYLANDPERKGVFPTTFVTFLS